LKEKNENLFSEARKFAISIRMKYLRTHDVIRFFLRSHPKMRILFFDKNGSHKGKNVKRYGNEGHQKKTVPGNNGSLAYRSFKNNLVELYRLRYNETK
jgi:hypothetical protein